MKTTENNKLIAEFMGFDFVAENPRYKLQSQNYLDVEYLSSYRFHTSWDWLMPVVEKIDKVCGIDLHEWDEFINDSLCTKNIEFVYSAVIKFIQWYNENKN